MKKGSPKPEIANLWEDEPTDASDGLSSDLLGDEAPALESDKAVLDEPRLLTRKTTRRQLIAAIREETLASFFVRLPKPGESVHIVSNGKWDYYGFLPATLDMLGRPAAEVYGSTWTMNNRNTRSLLELLDSRRIGKVSILTGTYFKRREAAVANVLVEGLLARGQRFRAFANHSKVMAISAEPDFLVIEGSANWTSNPRMEQTVVTNDRALFLFWKEILEEVLNA